MGLLSIAYFRVFGCGVYMGMPGFWATAVFLRDDEERISFP